MSNPGSPNSPHVPEVAGAADLAGGMVAIYIDPTPTERPEFLTERATVLDAFRLEGYDEAFFILGIDAEDHLEVVIVTQTRGYQVYPPEPGTSFQITNPDQSVDRLKEILFGYAVMMTKSTTPEKFAEWVEMCDKLNDQRRKELDVQ